MEVGGAGVKLYLLVGGDDTALATGGVDLGLGAGNCGTLSTAGADPLADLHDGIPLFSHCV